MFPVSLPIEEFNNFDTFIKKQLALVNNTNISGLRCSIKENKITYRNSQFEQLSKLMKQMYSSEIIRSYFYTERLISYLDDPYDMNPIKNKYPFFTDVFRNNENGSFLNYPIYFTHNILYYFQKKYEGVKINTLDFSNRLLRGEFDETFKEFKTYVYDRGASVIDIISKYKNIFENIGEIVKPVCSISFVDGGASYPSNFHSVAIIFWKTGGILNCGIYDPMYYYRDEYKHYTWPINTIYVTMKLLFPECIIHNLSQYCVRNEKGAHCIQYMIDAEYCPLYSLYFLYLYASKSFPIELDNIGNIVRKTFIVDNPDSLLRNPCISTNIFRLVMINFIMSVLILLYDNNTELNLIYDIYKELEKENYIVVVPDIYQILRGKIIKNNIIYLKKILSDLEKRKLSLNPSTYRVPGLYEKRLATIESQLQTDSSNLEENLSELKTLNPGIIKIVEDIVNAAEPKLENNENSSNGSNNNGTRSRIKLGGRRRKYKTKKIKRRAKRS